MIIAIILEIPFLLGFVIAATTGNDATPWVVGGLITPSVLAGLFLTGFVVRGKVYEQALERAEQAEQRERALRDATEDRIIPTQLRSLEIQQRSNEVLERVLITLARGER